MKQLSAVHRWAGDLVAGEELIAALAQWVATAEVTTAEVRASGIVDRITVHTFDSRTRAYGVARTLGAAEIVVLHGWLRLDAGAPVADLHAIVVHDGAVIAGEVSAATAASLTVFAEGWRDDVARESLREPTQPASLRDVARAVARRDEPVEKVIRNVPISPEHVEIPEPNQGRVERQEPEVGDFLEHPTFGIVEVDGEADAGRMRIKLATGSFREIMFEVFEVVPREPRNGKAFYSLRPRRR